ncbi:hypothetical protein HPB49_012854 [Dermacentor silvarum]|uniref:Uncharacterized protein n=1 Tax=Dermacentor silvarum TaxID=543639 RepID=A0ACB8CFA6_DERSI|nr:hypothetical protein HPB49_012854 [Dermacentor silvarum]
MKSERLPKPKIRRDNQSTSSDEGVETIEAKQQQIKVQKKAKSAAMRQQLLTSPTWTMALRVYPYYSGVIKRAEAAYKILKDSKPTLVKDTDEVAWGKDVLSKNSVTGAVALRKKCLGEVTKEPLTPEKVAVVTGQPRGDPEAAFAHFLQRRRQENPWCLQDIETLAKKRPSPKVLPKMTPVSSSPSSPTSSASSSSPTDCTNSDTASCLVAPSGSPVSVDDSMTSSSSAASPLSPESDATSSDVSVDNEQPPTTEGEPRSTGLPQRHDTHPPSPPPHVIPSVEPAQSTSTVLETPAAAADGQASAETMQEKSKKKALCCACVELGETRCNRVEEGKKKKQHAATGSTDSARASCVLGPPSPPGLCHTQEPGGNPPSLPEATPDSRSAISAVSGAVNPTSPVVDTAATLEDTPTAPTRQHTGSAETDVREKPQAQKKAGKRKTRFRPFLETTALASAASDQHADTILFHPVRKRACFLALSKEAIATQLSCIDGAHRVRVNFQRNVVAVDALPGADLSALLDVRAIADVPVRAKALAKNAYSGTIFGVDTPFDADTIRKNIEAPVAVLSCARSGRNVTVRLAGDVVPGDVLLFKQRRLVRPRLPRPLQCGRCSAFGHAEATCSRDARCLRCGDSHDTSSCTAQRPRCINCTGGHATLEPRCPNWQLERRVAILLAASEERISRHKALELAKARASSFAVQQRGGTAPRLSATVQPGLSFRDALTGTSAPPAEQTQPQQPATSDPRDALIAALAAALRVLLETTPMDDDVRQMCTAALAAQQALPHHG